MRLIQIHKMPQTINQQTGSILLEGLIAILLFSFGVLGLIGLQASTMKATTKAKERVDASLIANQRIAELWLSASNLEAKNEVDTTITELPNGKRTTVAKQATGKVTVTISWKSPGDSTENTYQTIACVRNNTQSGDCS